MAPSTVWKERTETIGDWIPHINKASNAFICNYNEPAGYDLPVVPELNQILSPCVLRKALKKQMTYGRRLRYQLTYLHVISMGPADNTRPI